MVGVERSDRTLQRRVEARVDRDVPEAAQDAGPFLKGEAGRGDVQIDVGRALIAVDAAVQRKRGPRRFDGELLEVPAGRAAAQRARQSD